MVQGNKLISLVDQEIVVQGNKLYPLINLVDQECAVQGNKLYPLISLVDQEVVLLGNKLLDNSLYQVIIYTYETEVLTLGLLWLGLNDAIKEGDGEKLFVHWKFLLLVFKCGECCNYSIEAVNLLYQTHASSPRLTAQLKWGRFINTHGQ